MKIISLGWQMMLICSAGFAEEAAQRLLTGPERLPPHQWTLASKRQAEALKVFAG